MYEFLKIQYALGRIDAVRLQTYVPQFLTQEQADTILGGDIAGNAGESA